jgi:hypothetical protein
MVARILFPCRGNIPDVSSNLEIPYICGKAQYPRGENSMRKHVISGASDLGFKILGNPSPNILFLGKIMMLSLAYSKIGS